MTASKRRKLRRFEGSGVNLALSDGSRLDDVNLVSARGMTLWLFDGGEDVFVPLAKVIDVWPSESAEYCGLTPSSLQTAAEAAAEQRPQRPQQGRHHAQYRAEFETPE